MLLYFLAFVHMALSCGPGSGPTTATPTMKFNYSCPLGWTWAVPGIGGQSSSKQMAQNRINADIQNAVISAVESYGYSTTGVTVKNAVAPENIEIIPAACSTITAVSTPPKANSDGVTVTKRCKGDAAGGEEDDIHTGVTITISSPVALAQSQWENIAIKVWAALTNDAGVKFHGLIEVDAK